MENPINYRSMKWPLITALSTLIIGILISTILIGSDILSAFIIFIPLSLLIFVVLGCWWECIRRPKTVVIAESGVIMKMRYCQGTEMVKWHEILYLSIFLNEDGSGKGSDGYIQYGRNIKRTLHRPIVISAREKYREIMGKYPPMKDGFH
jgi:hypothetical protein